MPTSTNTAPDDTKLSERFSITCTPLMKKMLTDSAADRGLGLSAEINTRLRKSLKLPAMERKPSATKNRKAVPTPAKVVSGKRRATKI